MCSHQDSTYHRINNNIKWLSNHVISSFASILCPCVILPKPNSEALQLLEDINRSYQVWETPKQLYNDEWGYLTSGTDTSSFCLSFSKRALHELVESSQYDTRSDFTVVIQPFFREIVVPRLPVSNNDNLHFWTEFWGIWKQSGELHSNQYNKLILRHQLQQSAKMLLGFSDLPTTIFPFLFIALSGFFFLQPATHCIALAKIVSYFTFLIDLRDLLASYVYLYLSHRTADPIAPSSVLTASISARRPRHRWLAPSGTTW